MPYQTRNQAITGGMSPHRGVRQERYGLKKGSIRVGQAASHGTSTGSQGTGMQWYRIPVQSRNVGWAYRSNHNTSINGAMWGGSTTVRRSNVKFRAQQGTTVSSRVIRHVKCSGRRLVIANNVRRRATRKASVYRHNNRNTMQRRNCWGVTNGVIIR